MGGQPGAGNLFCLNGFYTVVYFSLQMSVQTVVLWTQVRLDKVASQMCKIIFSTKQASFYECVTGNKMSPAISEAKSLFK